MNKIALAPAVIICTLAACGPTDDFDNPDNIDNIDNADNADNAENVDAETFDVLPADNEAAEPLTIDTIDADVTECLCRCVTPTNTLLKVHGAGFVPGAVVTIDGTQVNSWVSDPHTIEVSLWASPAPGEHDLVVAVFADAGDTSATASFVMPEPDQTAE